MAEQIEQLAFVLHRRPYRETSLLVTFFTEQYGKQNALIKGVRSASKASQAKQALLQPFQGVQLRWREKTMVAQDLITLYHFESAALRFPLMGESNLCGLYLNELLYRVLYPSIESNSLFQAYQQALYDLATASSRNTQAWALRQFEYALLTELGVALDLSLDYHGDPISVEKQYLFHLELGFFPEPFTQVTEGVVISGRCLHQFANLSYCESCLKDWKRLFQYCLAPFLGKRPIQARSLFQVQT